MRRAGLPGAVVGIAARHSPARVWALGSADAAGTVPIRRDHVFRIGSIAKAVVGHLLLHGMDESVLGLDDPVSKWLDGIPRGDEITVDMLARHRSGLANPIADPVFRAWLNQDPARHVTTPELLDHLRASERHDEPGVSFSYSNANTVLLSRIVIVSPDVGAGQVLAIRRVRPLMSSGFARRGPTTKARGGAMGAKQPYECVAVRVHRA
jgi:D-alanyl-D-alanine carboxypeptidase